MTRTASSTASLGSQSTCSRNAIRMVMFSPGNVSSSPASQQCISRTTSQTAAAAHASIPPADPPPALFELDLAVPRRA
ncbi:Putative small nuclear ribonucleoprotein F [Verticillium dahliae VDG1]|uniref:Uncharacterized protein n=1 Tax=Verticillium longisporum TaxID=100787 RepID=A0A0G4MMF2_VERLO|nr:Putative small nuclear ribonucleoprotein F [Verticillium dahliae VDG1]CRK35359.1 hypothetical protein BN1708_006702 [Verticillium longisporum]